MPLVYQQDIQQEDQDLNTTIRYLPRIGLPTTKDISEYLQNLNTLLAPFEKALENGETVVVKRHYSPPKCPEQHAILRNRLFYLQIIGDGKAPNPVVIHSRKAEYEDILANPKITYAIQASHTIPRKIKGQINVFAVINLDPQHLNDLPSRPNDYDVTVLIGA